MTKLRNTFAILLTVCHVWVLALPVAAACPCHHISKPSDNRDNPVTCCSSKADTSVKRCPTVLPSSCCHHQASSQVIAEPEEQGPAGCCTTKTTCPDRSRCLHSDLTATTSTSYTSDPTTVSSTALIHSASVVVADRHVHRGPDRPPGLDRISVHIPSTVLRC